MFGDQIRAGTGGASIYHSAEELKKLWFGTNGHLNGNPIPDVDDYLGYRLGQSRAVQTTRIPRKSVVVRAVNGTTTNQPQEFDIASHSGGQGLKNVTGVGVSKIWITGIGGGVHTSLFVSFFGDNYRHAFNTSSNLLLGFPNIRHQGMVIEGNTGAATEVLVNPGTTMFLGSFMKPQDVDHFNVSLTDLSGALVPFGELVLFLEVETEIHQ